MPIEAILLARYPMLPFVRLEGEWYDALDVEAPQQQVPLIYNVIHV